MRRLQQASVLALAAAMLTGCAEPGTKGRRISPSQEQIMKAKVKREGGKVWIEGVKGWHSGERGSSIHAVQAAIMAAAGEDITYTDLMGASGLAFRMQVHKELCPSSPHSCCGHQCLVGSGRALPWKIRVLEVKPDDAEGVARARKAVVASIDRGVPVQYGSEEDGVIIGYQAGGEQWLCLHPWHGDGGKMFVETKWPWGIAVYTEPKPAAPSRKELALAALRQAVEMSRADNVEDYVLGSKAWGVWLAKLAELETLDTKARDKYMTGNSWIYATLVEYRGVAADYLWSVAGEFGKDATGHLKTAAGLYAKMSGEVLTDKDHCALDVAPPPWFLKKDRKWTKAMRADQVRRLKQALPLERQAITEIEKALRADSAGT